MIDLSIAMQFCEFLRHARKLSSLHHESRCICAYPGISYICQNIGLYPGLWRQRRLLHQPALRRETPKLSVQCMEYFYMKATCSFRANSVLPTALSDNKYTVLKS